MSAEYVLRKHHLLHIPELKIDEGIFRHRFREDCSMLHCGGKCCRSGVTLGIEERAKILEHADLIQQHMPEGHEKNPANWFVDEFDHPDFASGRAAETCVRNEACVFLDSDARCVLQRVEAQVPPNVGALKPFYCRAFPICVDFGVLMIDDEHCPDENRCCGPVADGPLTIFDVCAFELEYVLGAAGLAELRDLTRSVLASRPVPGDEG